MNNQGIQRRTMLRQLLAGGCVLLLPSVTGCDKKSDNPEPATTPGNESLPPTSDTRMTPPQNGVEAEGNASSSKLAQAAVQYQDQPKGEESCANCLHFVAADSSCKLVEGPVSPQGWCSIWVKQAT